MVLFCIHALGLSSKSYDNFGRRMAAAGVPTYAMDVRGFGGWMNNPETAHLDFEACLTDVEQGLKTLHKAYPRLPVFLVGESMGGAIAIQAAARYPEQVNGVISAVPSSTERSGSFLKSGTVMVFESAVAPSGKMEMDPVIVDRAVSNPALRQRIKDEPLNRSKLSKGELAEFQNFMDETHDSAPLVERKPAMFLVAYKDKLVTPAGSIDLLSEMTTAMKLMIIDGNSEHLMLEESQMTPEIERLLKSWLNDHAGTALSEQAGRSTATLNKDWTTYQRQVSVMKRINEAHKTRQITERQARELRKDLSDLATQKQKQRDSSTGNEMNVEMIGIDAELSKISEKIETVKQKNIENGR